MSHDQLRGPGHRSSDDPLPLIRAGDPGHHGRPGREGPDTLAGEQSFAHSVDGTLHPGLPELAQRLQVGGPEVVGEGASHPVCGVDPARGDALTEGPGREVDEDDLPGADELVRHRLDRARPSDARGVVPHRREVGHVGGGHHRQARVQQVGDLLPPTALAVCVGVSQLVDQDDVRSGGHDRVEVELFELPVAVQDHPGRHDLEVPELGLGLAATMALDPADHDFLARLRPAPRLAEHGVGLAHAGGRAQVRAQPA